MSDKQKSFLITGGKGFQITFANNYTVSVQFGWGNYCDNYDNEYEQQKLNIQNGIFPKSNTAETALLDGFGEFVPYSHDDSENYDVQGRATAEQVLKLLVYAESLPRQEANKDKG